MALFDLFNIVFTEFLKISPDLLSKYTTIQDQLLYLVLIPHAVLFLFLFGFGIFIAHEHRGLKFLLRITAYIFIVWAGWYGTILVPLTIGWFYIMLGVALIVFFVAKIFHPVTAQALGGVAAKVLGEIGDKTIGKEKERETLEDEIKMVNDQIRTLEAELHHPGITPMAASYAQMQIQQLKSQLVALKRKASKL